MNPFNRRNSIRCLVTSAMLFAGSLLSSVAIADQTIDALALQWASIRFGEDAGEQEAAFAKLDAKAAQILSEHPGNAELLTWAGIIRSSLAGARGGLGGLKLAKQSRELFNSAMEIDPDALEGGARSSLGVLYAKVPGRPIGFGNRARAENLLRESATRFPDSFSSLYFLAEFLDENGQRDEAVENYWKVIELTSSVEPTLQSDGFQKMANERLAALGESGA